MMNCSWAPCEGVSNIAVNKDDTATNVSDDGSSNGIGRTGREVAATRAAT